MVIRCDSSIVWEQTLRTKASVFVSSNCNQTPIDYFVKPILFFKQEAQLKKTAPPDEQVLLYLFKESEDPIEYSSHESIQLFLKCLAREIGKFGIRVFSIQFDPRCSIEQIQNCVSFLSSPVCSYCTGETYKLYFNREDRYDSKSFNVSY
jgi:hypothetical protein